MKRKIKFRRYLFSGLVPFLFYWFGPCSYDDDVEAQYYDIKVTNKTSETVYAVEYCFFDTTFLSAYHVFEVLPEGRLKRTPADSSFVGFVASAASYSPSDTATTYQVMIFKQSTLDRYSKDELVEKNIYDKLYVWTYDEWKSRNFQVDYTGD